MIFAVALLYLLANAIGGCVVGNEDCIETEITEMKVSMLQKRQKLIMNHEEKKRTHVSQSEAAVAQQRNAIVARLAQWQGRACDESSIDRRRRDGQMCACRRRDGASSTNKYTCVGDSLTMIYPALNCAEDADIPWMFKIGPCMTFETNVISSPFMGDTGTGPVYEYGYKASWDGDVYACKKYQLIFSRSCTNCHLWGEKDHKETAVGTVTNLRKVEAMRHTFQDVLDSPANVESNDYYPVYQDRKVGIKADIEWQYEYCQDWQCTTSKPKKILGSMTTWTSVLGHGDMISFVQVPCFGSEETVASCAAIMQTDWWSCN